MQPLGTPCQRLAWAAALAVAAFIDPSWALAPAGMRVDFAKHGSDWVQGNCASRKKQSPIDLNELFKPPGGTFQYNYDEVSGRNISFTNDGRMLSATLANGSFGETSGLALDLRGEATWFNLSSIDIKSVSEHTLRGQHYPIEIQLVHRPQHFYPKGGGPESVTVSIFVDCPSPPKAEPVYPGLLQKSTRPGRRLRGKGGMALMQQAPEDDSRMPAPAGMEAEDEDTDPAHQRMDAEVNFVHTLVEGEDFLAASPAAAAPGAPGPAAGPGAAEEEYRVPSAMDPNFNPLLQFLVEQEPPDLDATVNTGIGPDTPLRLGELLAGGTYFYYAGSSTLPPCAERDLWLIKREVVQASNEQVKALHSAIHLLSGGAGNFRTSMPVNQRAVQVLGGKEGIPRGLQRSSTVDHDHSTPGKEQKYIDMAKDAITIAKAASDYAKDMDWRVQAGSTAHLRAMEAMEVTTPAPTTSAFIPRPPEDQIWATNIMSKVVKQGIHDALKANIDEMIPATVSLTGSYLRQRILKKGAFNPPPVGATVVAPEPIPGVPTFFPPQQFSMPSEQNLTNLANALEASNCTEAANFSGCAQMANSTGLTPAQAVAISQKMQAIAPGKAQQDDANQMTPEQVAASLPAGVQPVPADWPDLQGWPNGLPPANYAQNPSVWPDPSGSMPAGWTPYRWERYQYNWQVYRSSYEPYRSAYSSYQIHRRRRASSTRRSSYKSNYGGRRRSSYSSSSGRRRSSSFSSRRRGRNRRSRSSRRRSSWR